jgi:hypothetical protein
MIFSKWRAQAQSKILQVGTTAYKARVWLWSAFAVYVESVTQSPEPTGRTANRVLSLLVIVFNCSCRYATSYRVLVTMKPQYATGSVAALRTQQRWGLWLDSQPVILSLLCNQSY